MLVPLRAVGVRLLLAFWLALSLGESGLVHACPMHDGAAAGSTGSHGMHASARDSVHAAHDGSGGGSQHDVQAVHDRSDDGQAACTCLGTCGVPGVAAILADSPRVPDAIVATAAAIATSGAEIAHARDAHFHPFANGPPRSSRGAVSSHPAA